jgi:hypothetical protein
MKKFLFLMVLCSTVFFIANAQVEKGNVMTGGDLADLHLALNNGGEFSMMVAPKAAWFVQDKVGVGGYALLGINTAKGAGLSMNYGGGVLGRYYTGKRFPADVSRTRVFVETSVGIEGYKPVEGDNTTGLALGVGPGVAYFITPNVGLEALAKYKGLIGFGTSEATSSLNLNVGFQVYLSKRKAKNAVKNITQ